MDIAEFTELWMLLGCTAVPCALWRGLVTRHDAVAWCHGGTALFATLVLRATLFATPYSVPPLTPSNKRDVAALTNRWNYRRTILHW